MKYRLVSRRKYFYNCPICALVYITAKALKAHYAAVHPTLPCDVEELATDPMDDDERFEEFCENSSSNYLYKDDSRLDLYSLPKAQVLTTVPAEMSTAPAAAPGPSLINELVDYVPVTYSPTTYSPANRLITLTAPLEPATVSFHPQQFQLTTTSNINPPIYTIKLETGEILQQQQNGQIPKQATIITEVQPPSHLPVVIEPPQLPPQSLPLLPQHQQQQIETVTISTATKATATAALPADNGSQKSDKKYSCEPCGKFFSTIYNKRRHDDMFHSNGAQSSAEYKCSSCDKVFSSIYNKTRHENVHKPINERLKYKCVINDCNRGFTTQFILKMHIKKVHNMEVNF